MSENEMDLQENEDSTDEDDDDDMEESSEDVLESKQNEESTSDVYLPGQPIKEGEELVCDQTAYIMLHQAQAGAACLSFDIIEDNLGSHRDSYPVTAYIVAGTQAPHAFVNNVITMKLSNLHRTNVNIEDDDDEESEGEAESKNPQMAGASIRHQGCINRIRSTNINNVIVAASWSELGRVNIWELTPQLQAVDDSILLSKYNKDQIGYTFPPLFTFTGHMQEGYAIDWCKPTPGVLATGDCMSHIHIWHPSSGGSWKVDQRPLTSHTASVEDLQWSPNEANVLASCSVDKSIRIYDVRAASGKACMLKCENAHKSDVNVISWNKNEPLIVSGGDDGIVHVWDLRRFQDKTPVATFKHHTEPVTTVEWHPTDSTVFASGGSDNQIAIWDLSVEKDTEAEEDDIDDVPPQLLFIHQGQTDIKELHWHPQIPGVIISTAQNGFNIFRTISV